MEKRRSVVKIGTTALMEKSHQKNPDMTLMIDLARDMINVTRSEIGSQLALVSSGAVGIGMSKMGSKLEKDFTELSPAEKSALAMIGEPNKVGLWQQAFGLVDPRQLVSQTLLEHRHFEHPQIMDNLREAIFQCLEWNTIPILNENDAVDWEELLKIGKGDNDALAFKAANLLNAEHLIILTDQKGIYSGEVGKSDVFDELKASEITEHFINTYIKNSDGKKNGAAKGGARSKIEAARNAANNGITTHIVKADEPEVISRILLKDEPIGTRIIPVQVL